MKIAILFLLLLVYGAAFTALILSFLEWLAAEGSPRTLILTFAFTLIFTLSIAAITL